MGLQILHPLPSETKNIDITSHLTLEFVPPSLPTVTPLRTKTSTHHIFKSIIAIHGLNGHSTRTWTSPTTQVLWHRDLLPHSLPQTRTMTFGYDATAAFSSTTSGILEHARDLLRCISESRNLLHEKSRPLIFIAHSLGGLVLKQALLIAAEAGEGREYANIWSSTLGILFFGTPHRGSSLAGYGVSLARVPTALSMKSEPVLLHALRTGSLLLGELNEDFRILMERRGEGREIISFYETKGMAGVGMVVEPSSATVNSAGKFVGWEIPVPVVGNHRDMCRFDCSEDPTYVTAVHSIQRLRKRTMRGEEVKNEWFVVEQVVNPHFTGRNEMRSEMREALLGQRFTGEKEQKRFVLFGLGGSGKTQVCLKFAQDFRDRFWAIFFIDASSISTATEGFQKIAKKVKIKGSNPASTIIDTVKNFISTKEYWLLIIDNADDPRLDVSRFFPTGTKGSILITTRNPDFVKFANVGSQCVEQMEEEDAVALLLKTSGLGNAPKEAMKMKKDEARKVAKTLGCLALAIIQAGAVIRQGLVSLSGFCELYGKRKRELLESGIPDASTEYQRSVYTTWEISLKMIGEISETHSIFALELLRHFSLMHFDGIREAMFGDAWNNEKLLDCRTTYFASTLLISLMPQEWNQILMGKALGLLTSFSLITVDAERRISMHPLVHQWSRDRMTEGELKSAWLNAVFTIAMGASWESDIEINLQRRLLIPHINACLHQCEDRLFLDGPNLHDRIFAALSFQRAYADNNDPKAILLSRKVFECVKKKLDTGNPLYVSALEAYAFDLSTIGRNEEASEIWIELLRNQEALSTAETTATYTNRLAITYTDSANPEKAIQLCEKLLEEHQNSALIGNGTVIETLETMGAAYFVSRKWKEARKCLEEALERRKTMGGDDPNFMSITALCCLAMTYSNLKQHKKAIATQKQVINLETQFFGAENLRTITSTARLEDIKYAAGFVLSSFMRRGKMLATTEKALKQMEETQDEVSTTTLFYMIQLAEDYCTVGSLDKARTLQETVLEIYTKQWGEDHPDTLAAAAKLKRTKRMIFGRKAAYWWVPKTIGKKFKM